MDLGSSERVEEKDFRSFVDDKKPTMGGAAAATAVGGFWKVEEVEFVEGEVEEGTVGVMRLGLRKHQPWELSGKAVGHFGDGGSPVVAHRSEADIIGVDLKLFGYEI